MLRRKIEGPVCEVSGQTRHEEIINSITHGLTALLSIFGFFVLVFSAYQSGRVWHVTSSVVFGLSLVLLYLSSTLYHASKNTARKRKLKVLDHAAIFLLIAGSYTPFTLGPLRDTPWGWSLFFIIWGLALAGIVFKLFFAHRFKIASTFFYLGMGWIAVFAVPALVEALPSQAIYGMLAGGLFYSFGTVFYLVKKIPYHHGFWHICVTAGSACHFFTIWWYVFV